MNGPSIVVIGGAHGGLTAASRARQINENARIVLLEKSEHLTWVQADLRHHLVGDLSRFEKTLSKRAKHFQDRYRVEVRTQHEALSLDMDARCVHIKSPQGEERIRFDAVVYAGGAISKPSGVEGLSGSNVCNFRNLHDIRVIKKSVENGAKKAVVLGCGVYGIEAAQVLHAMGMHVSVVEKNPRILQRFTIQAAKSAQLALEKLGIDLHLNNYVVTTEEKVKMGFFLTLACGKTLEADLVVVTLGSIPRTDFLANAGAALQSDGSLRVDAHMATTLSNVYACGSAISVPQVLSHERRWMPKPSIVNRTAQVAGFNAAASSLLPKDRFEEVAGTLLIKVGDVWHARTGLTLSESNKAFGEDAVLSLTVHGRSSEVWQEGESIAVHLLVNRHTQAIIGGEVWGKRGIDRRIDLIATAITHGFTPKNLVDLDMSYSSELGPAFDSLKEAAMLADLSMKEQSQLISSDKLALWLTEKKPFTLIDVGLEAQSAPKGSGVHFLPLEELRDRLDEIDRRFPVIVSSQSGRRAFLAQRVLEQRGFADVYHLDGGSLTWSLLMN